MDKEGICHNIGESRRPRRKKWEIVPVFKLPHCCAVKRPGNLITIRTKGIWMLTSLERVIDNKDHNLETFFLKMTSTGLALDDLNGLEDYYSLLLRYDSTERKLVSQSVNK